MAFMAVFGVFVTIGFFPQHAGFDISHVHLGLNCSEPDELLRSRL